MTAVVGILNKRAVAIAADSASTSNSGKIINKAHKIFTLSKYYPVGVMIHNMDSFMGTPWEIIIKLYRKKLKHTSFNTLAEYQNDFIEFIKQENFFCDENNQSFELNLFCLGINELFINSINKILHENDPDWKNKFKTQLRIQATKHFDYYSEIKEVLPDFKEYTYEDFNNFIEVRLQEIIDYTFKNMGIDIDAECRELLKKAYYSELIVKEFSTIKFTGLVFTGFGEKDIFPSLIPVHIYFGFDQKLRYFINSVRGAMITHDTSSAICTFAQSDVMLTILTGIAPDLQEIYNLNFENFLNKYDEIILNNYQTEKTELISLLNSIDKNNIVKLLTDLMDDTIKSKYVNPLFDTVAGLSKEDLAEMAESLIYLTYLQRRITNAEESVGGPVDVAILTKGDGFIWIKRKHYFKPELNSHFFKNYFT